MTTFTVTVPETLGKDLAPYQPYMSMILSVGLERLLYLGVLPHIAQAPSHALSQAHQVEVSNGDHVSFERGWFEQVFPTIDLGYELDLDNAKIDAEIVKTML